MDPTPTGQLRSRMGTMPGLRPCLMTCSVSIDSPTTEPRAAEVQRPSTRIRPTADRHRDSRRTAWADLLHRRASPGPTRHHRTRFALTNQSIRPAAPRLHSHVETARPRFALGVRHAAGELQPPPQLRSADRGRHRAEAGVSPGSLEPARRMGLRSARTLSRPSPQAIRPGGM